MRTSIKIIAIAYILYGCAMLAFVGNRVFQAYKLGIGDAVVANGVPLLTLGAIGIVAFGLACFLGYLLFKLKNRKTIITLSCILLIGFPVGTLLGIATLCLLQTEEIKNGFGS